MKLLISFRLIYIICMFYDTYYFMILRAELETDLIYHRQKENNIFMLNLFAVTSLLFSNVGIAINNSYVIIIILKEKALLINERFTLSILYAMIAKLF